MASKTKKQLVAREYLRVSKSDGDRGTESSRSTDDQHADNKAAVKKQGWKLHAEPFVEPDISASRFSTEERARFQAMVADMEAGQFGADVLVLWENSRGSRRPGEWIDLLEICAEQGIRIWVTSHGRLYDPNVSYDRKTLLTAAVDSEYESGLTSERLKRTMKRNAKKGRVHGKNLYGYRRLREYDPKKRKEVIKKIIPDPEQAPVVREAVRMLLAGSSYYAVAKHFNEQGYPTRRKAYKDHNQHRGWTAVSIKQMVEMPAYRGLRQHTTEVIKDGKKMKRQRFYKVKQWPPLISAEEWAGLEARFKHDKAKWPRERSDEIKHLLTGVARCAVCGSIMRVGKQNAGPRKVVIDDAGAPVLYPKGHRYAGKPKKVSEGSYSTYICQGAPGRTGFHVAMREEHLDDAITRAVLARLEAPDFLARAGGRDDAVDAERQAVLDEIAGHEAWLEAVRERATRERKLDLLFDQQDRTEPLIRAAQRKLEALVKVDPEVLELVKAGDVRRRWAGLSVGERRDIVAAVVTPVIDRVPPERRGRRGIDLERIELIWK